jgi:hypothetical protein
VIDEQKKVCAVQGEELEVIEGYLKDGTGTPQVLVTKTVLLDVDVDALNLQLAVKGQEFLPMSEPTSRRKINPAV